MEFRQATQAFLMETRRQRPNQKYQYVLDFTKLRKRLEKEILQLLN